MADAGDRPRRVPFNVAVFPHLAGECVHNVSLAVPCGACEDALGPGLHPPARLVLARERALASGAVLADEPRPLPAPAPDPHGPGALWPKWHVDEWMRAEHGYAEAKFAMFAAGRPMPELLEGAAYEQWLGIAHAYLDRARVFGADSPAGRQALAKAARIARHILESAVEVHGPLPPGGATSGDLGG